MESKCAFSLVPLLSFTSETLLEYLDLLIQIHSQGIRFTECVETEQSITYKHIDYEVKYQPDSEQLYL